MTFSTILSSAAAADPAQLEAHGLALRAEGKWSEAADVFARIAAALPKQWLPSFNAGVVYAEANRLAEAATAFERAVDLRPGDPSIYVNLAQVLARDDRMPAAKTAFENALRFDPANFDALWGLYEVESVLENDRAAIGYQRRALHERRTFSLLAASQPAICNVLALCAPGNVGINVPLEYVIDRSRFTLHKLYLTGEPLPPLPQYDVVFNAIAHAPEIAPVLAEADRFIASQTQPSINAPAAVPLTSREAIAERFRTSASVVAVDASAVARARVRDAGRELPFLIRPLDSHAGRDLAKIEDRAQLDAYLAISRDDAYYLAPFIDYRNADAHFRKYRVIFVEGVAYPCHLAISTNWMIHYYNAPMETHAWMRDEEHAFMRDITSVFDGIRGEALDEIARAIPLDYFGIDCSIAPDGRVLLFEASAAMLVHTNDPIDLYPYKAEYVPRITRALETLIARLRDGAAAG